MTCLKVLQARLGTRGVIIKIGRFGGEIGINNPIMYRPYHINGCEPPEKAWHHGDQNIMESWLREGKGAME